MSSVNLLDYFMFIIYGAIAQWLRRWIPNPGVPCSKPLGGSKVDSAFHPYQEFLGTEW